MGGTTNTILPSKIEKIKGKSQIFKNFLDGFRWFELEGGNKVAENGNKELYLSGINIYISDRSVFYVLNFVEKNRDLKS